MSRSPASTPILPAPDARAAADAALRLLGSKAVSLRRFGVGTSHWVYDVRLETGEAAVLRMTTVDQAPVMAAALRLNRLLRPLGVPLPRILGAELTGVHPTLALERLDGTDLQDVMATLRPDVRAQIVRRVVDAQRRVARLPSAGRFGYAARPEAAPHETWFEVLSASLERSRRRIARAGLFPIALVDPVERLLFETAPDAQMVAAVPFLHDTTTKNVIVAPDGRFSGIVDVDDLCWGDGRFAPALTLAAIEAFGGPADYVSTWMRLAGFADDRLFRVYVALFTLGFVADRGAALNGAVEAADPAMCARLQGALERAVTTASDGPSPR